MHFCSSYFTTCDDQVLWIIFLVYYFMYVYIQGETFVLCTFKFQLTCVSMAFHQNYSRGACFKGAILGETQGNSVPCVWMIIRIALDFAAVSKMIQKTFLRQKRAWGSPAVGRKMQRFLQGWWVWVLLPNQPPTDAVSWVSNLHGRMGSKGNFGCALAGHRNLRGRTFVYPQTTQHLSTAWLSQEEMWGWEEQFLRFGIFDLCWLILHQRKDVAPRLHRSAWILSVPVFV